MLPIDYTCMKEVKWIIFQILILEYEKKEPPAPQGEAAPKWAYSI